MAPVFLRLDVLLLFMHILTMLAARFSKTLNQLIPTCDT